MMIHILLILLGILGIILIGIAIILFVPIRYRIKMLKREESEKLHIELHAHWLLKLFRVDVFYLDETLDWNVRLAWKRVEQKESKESQRKHSKKKVKKKIAEEKVTEESGSNNTLFEKIKYTIINICDKIKEIWDTKKNITDFITDERHLSAFGRVKKELFDLVKKLFPYHLKGFVRYGCEDPYNTGRILALLSVVYPFYGEKIDIFPEFDHKVFLCDLHAKGRIRSIGFIIAICNLFFNKDVRFTYKNYMSLKK